MGSEISNVVDIVAQVAKPEHDRRVACWFTDRRAARRPRVVGMTGRPLAGRAGRHGTLADGAGAGSIAGRAWISRIAGAGRSRAAGSRARCDAGMAGWLHDYRSSAARGKGRRFPRLLLALDRDAYGADAKGCCAGQEDESCSAHGEGFLYRARAPQVSAGMSRLPPEVGCWTNPGSQHAEASARHGWGRAGGLRSRPGQRRRPFGPRLQSLPRLRRPGR